MREKRSGDLSGIVMLWEVDSEKALGEVAVEERKTRENMLGLSCWSMVEVRLKVVLGGKWTWKICWVWWAQPGAGLEAIVDAAGVIESVGTMARPERRVARYKCEV
jgi:hypothetical protein